MLKKKVLCVSMEMSGYQGIFIELMCMVMDLLAFFKSNRGYYNTNERNAYLEIANARVLRGPESWASVRTDTCTFTVAL